MERQWRGIDWGYGKYELEQKHIDSAREIYNQYIKNTQTDNKKEV